MAIEYGQGSGAHPASGDTGKLPIDDGHGNGVVPDSDQTGSTAIDHANGNGTTPASEETGKERGGNGARSQMTPLEAWVRDDPWPSDAESADVKVGQASSPPSFPPVAPVPVHPPPLAPSADAATTPPRPTRRIHTWPQRIGVILIAATCVAAAVWYIPRVVSTNRQMFTGTVASGGVITLNFPNSGEIKRIYVRSGQTVHKGQVLASESAPDVSAVVKAEMAAMDADRAKIAQLKSQQAQGGLNPSTGVAQLSAANSQFAFDQAQLNSNRAKLAASRITAPASGVVVAANGQPGQVVTSSGIRDYAADSRSSPSSQRPAFSLLPEGPQPLRSSSPRESTLPVIALRTSTEWTVVAMIPENAASRVRQGRAVTISVPAAGIKGVPGKVDEVLPSPVTTAQGTAYQAVIKVTGHVVHEPLNGMAVDIRLN